MRDLLYYYSQIVIKTKTILIVFEVCLKTFARIKIKEKSILIILLFFFVYSSLLFSKKLQFFFFSQFQVYMIFHKYFSRIDFCCIYLYIYVAIYSILEKNKSKK